MKFTSEMMKKVHKLAKKMEGHFYCRLSLAFQEIIKEARSVKEITVKEMEALLEKDYKDFAEGEWKIQSYSKRQADKITVYLEKFMYSKRGQKKSKTLAKVEMLASGEVTADVEGYTEYKAIGIKSTVETLKEETKKLEAEAGEMELANLEGSEKQIAWAEKIRLEKIKMVRDFLPKLDRLYTDKELAEEIEEYREAIENLRTKLESKLAEFKKESSSVTWIESIRHQVIKDYVYKNQLQEDVVNYVTDNYR